MSARDEATHPVKISQIPIFSARRISFLYRDLIVRLPPSEEFCALSTSPVVPTTGFSVELAILSLVLEVPLSAAAPSSTGFSLFVV